MPTTPRPAMIGQSRLRVCLPDPVSLALDRPPPRHIVSPPRATSTVMFGNDNGRYEWLTWGLGFPTVGRSTSASRCQRSYSNQASAHDLAAWSAGFTSRPSDYFGFAAVGQNLNAPTTDAGGFVDRTYNFAVAIRPGRAAPRPEVGLEALYVDAKGGYWVPRFTLGVDVPELGRLRGDFAYSDPGNEVGQKQWLASASFAFNFNGSSGSAEVSGGACSATTLGCRQEPTRRRRLWARNRSTRVPRQRGG